MNDYIDIKQKEFTEIKIAEKITILITKLELFKSVSFQVHIFDNLNNHIKTECLTLEGEDYNMWSNDDNYIVDYAMLKLGLTKL